MSCVATVTIQLLTVPHIKKEMELAHSNTYWAVQYYFWRVAYTNVEAYIQDLPNISHNSIAAVDLLIIVTIFWYLYLGNTHVANHDDHSLEIIECCLYLEGK